MKALNDIDEKVLLQQFVTGDQHAFTTIYTIYWPILFSHALRLLQHEEDARDVVQELFLNFHAKSESLSPETKISAYLYISLRNKILNQIRHEKIKLNYLDDLRQFASQADHTILEYIHEKELKKVIDSEIERLPPKMRRIFQLSRNEYLSHKEIALQLEISDKTVKTQINNALKSLRLKIGALLFFQFWLFSSTILL